MSNISYRRHSLLYGESLFIAFLGCFAPFFYWPDSSTTKTKHLFITTPMGRSWLKILIALWNYSPIRILAIGSLVLTQIAYAIILLTFGISVQLDYVDLFEKLNEEHLAYKALYYAPVLHRVGLFLMIVIALCGRADYKQWPVIDNFEIFSVDRTRQWRIMVLCILSMLPDIFCSLTDMMRLVNMVQASGHTMLGIKSMLFQGSAGYLFLFTMGLVSTSSCIIRYKPFISVLYSSTCVSRHLGFLRSQLQRSQGRINPFAHSPGSLLGALRGAGRAAVPRARPTLEMAGAGLELPAAPWAGGRGHMSEILCQSRRQPRASAAAAAAAAAAANDYVDEDPLYEIRSLFELEKHLTQVYLFTAALDRCSPISIFLLTLLNLIAFFYSFLHLRAAPADSINYPLAIILLGARILPIGLLLTIGHLVERECRQLSDFIEVAHLQNSSHCLLYRELKDSQHSLMSIFRLLTWIRFHCDGVMAVNLGTLKRLTLYVASGIFIVIQQEWLLVIERPSAQLPAAPNRRPELDGHLIARDTTSSGISDYLRLALDFY